MASSVDVVCGVFLILISATITIGAETLFTSNISCSSLKRSSFPKGFIFGAASSAYQVEGAANVGGKGASIWDTYTHEFPERISDRSNGDISVDHFHRYKEDIELMKEMNMDAYRFSISWPRILPKGRVSGGVNKEGIKHYNNLINELLAKGLKPFVTIFHWDLPQPLEDEYGGFLSPNIVNDFEEFADLCFKEFGDRVKHWITLNEPHVFSKFGYAEGVLAPGRCSAWQNKNCTGGDSATEPYIVGHNQLLAHAAAVKIYKTKYQKSQKGIIGITLSYSWVVPLYDTKMDRLAAQRALDFELGWFMEPLTKGRYPNSMKSLVGNRLPKLLSEKEAKLIKGSFDFIGLNYYTSSYGTSALKSSEARPSFLTDSRVNVTSERDGIPIGKKIKSLWIHSYPEGIYQLMLYMKTNYNNPVIYITENGVDEYSTRNLALEEAIGDAYRIDYHRDHLHYLQRAIKNGVNLKGYFAWSLLDSFEWSFGYNSRFGIIFVDYNNNLRRHPKQSAIWFRNFLQRQIYSSI